MPRRRRRRRRMMSALTIVRAARAAAKNALDSLREEIRSTATRLEKLLTEERSFKTDLFGAGTPATLIVQAVLLHQSLNVVPEWPNPASLSEAEFSCCLYPALLPLLEAVMLVDSDAWQLFDPISKAKFRQSTLAVFAQVRRAVGS